MFEFSFPFQLNVGPLLDDKFLSWSRIDCSPRRRKRMQLPKCVLVKANVKIIGLMFYLTLLFYKFFLSSMIHKLLWDLAPNSRKKIENENASLIFFNHACSHTDYYRCSHVITARTFSIETHNLFWEHQLYKVHR